MKVTAHLELRKGYDLAISASQWRDELVQQCDEYNEEYTRGDWRRTGREAAVVTVEFEVPDSVFDPPPEPIVIQTKIK